MPEQHELKSTIQTERSRAEHLVVQTAFLGDVLLGIPLLREIKKRYPNDKLTILCRSGLGDFLKQSGLVDEAIEIKKGPKSQRADSWRIAKATLRERRFENVICPHQSLRSSFFVAGLRASKKIGYSSFLNKIIFSHTVKRPMHLPEAIRQLALLESLDKSWHVRISEFEATQKRPGGQSEDGVLAAVPEWAQMALPQLLKLKNKWRESKSFSDLLRKRDGEGLSHSTMQLAARINPHLQRMAVLSPGSVWPTKKWTLSGYIEVAKALVRDHYLVVIMGSKDERELCEEIAQAVPGAVSIAGETHLHESLELLALADFMVCNDSGSMHMAACAGLPSVAIFGPTVLEFGYRPWQNAATVVQVEREKMPCRPCGKHGSQACPLGTHACMKQITSDQVMQHILKL